MTAVREIDREHRAAATLARFAQVLAGIDPPAPVPSREEPPPAQPSIPPPRSNRRPWGPGHRPGVHDVLTWKEALQLEWIVETPVEANPCLSAEDQSLRPKNWVAPYSNGDFIFPSYAQEAEEAADGNAGDEEL